MRRPSFDPFFTYKLVRIIARNSSSPPFTDLSLGVDRSRVHSYILYTIQFILLYRMIDK